MREPKMHIDSLFRAVTGPCSTDRLDVELVEARLVSPGCAPRIGRFILIEEVGRGGMGVVFAAFDAELERKVAVKLLHADVPRERLLREAQALAKMDHANLVTIYEAGEDHGQGYIAMEFVDGRSLAELQRQSPAPWRHWLRIYLEAGRGLHHVHLAGLVHRDFKPDNVLVQRDGRVVVADFGLAKLSAVTAPGCADTDPGDATDDRLTHAGARPGTVRYMAPEQLMGDDCDARSDQYSFCLALWQAVHGELPLGIHERDQIDAWRSLGHKRLKTPMWFRRILLRGLHPEPRLRWPSMEALLDRLQQDPIAQLRRAALGVFAGLAVVAVAWLVREYLDAAANEALAEAAVRQSQSELAELVQHRLDDVLTWATWRERDPAVRSNFLVDVRDPDATTEWRNAAIDTLLRPSSLAILRGHSGELRGVAFSPDGRLVATASLDHTIRLWRSDGQEEPQPPLRGHTDAVHLVAFSPDGRLLASTSRDRTVRLWDLSRPGTAPQVLVGHQGPVWYVAFSPDGRWLATSGDHGQVLLWQRSDDGLDFRSSGALLGHEGDVWQVEFSADGRQLVSAGDDHTARIWSLETQTLLRILPHDGNVLRAHFSPDGTKVVAASQTAAPRVWRVADGQRLHTLAADGQGVQDARFDPSGELIATAGNDGSAKLWSAASGRPLRRLKLGPGTSAIAFSPTGDLFAAASPSGDVRVWRTEGYGGAYELIGHQASVFQLEFSADGRYLVASSYDRTARVWDADALRHGPSQPILEDVPNRGLACASATLFALAREDTIELHDRETGRLRRRLHVPAGTARWCVLSPDSQAMLALATDGALYRWDLSRDDRELLVSTDANEFIFATGGDALVGHQDGSISLFNGTGERIDRVKAHAKAVNSFSELLQGRYIASAGVDGSLVRLDVSDGLRPQELSPPTGFRLAGNRGCADRGLLPVWNSRNGSVLLWDIPRGVIAHEFGGKVPKWVDLDCKRNLLAIMPRSGGIQRWTLGGSRLSPQPPGLGGGAWSAVFNDEAALLLLSDLHGGLRIFEATTFTEKAALEDVGTPLQVGGDDGALLLMSPAGGVTRIELSALLRPNDELRVELRRRTTACPDLEQWRAVYSQDEAGARRAAEKCAARHGRGAPGLASW
ncbi:protein kinase [Nannocystis sp. RBIL2]|uniref:WD40 repeat domain-containing serine/threonine-protein kinase n=1 Tax=Nannocystis sp. RBIL2 TaxID=2996788 RepID=UPI00226F6BD0|nr:protein kinase [Nannocystis sp. RBIL2]MCY1071004.1 protein kinase [Nannocystis sp. RBIL2]